MSGSISDQTSWPWCRNRQEDTSGNSTEALHMMTSYYLDTGVRMAAGHLLTRVCTRRKGSVSRGRYCTPPHMSSTLLVSSLTLARYLRWDLS